MQRVFLSLAGLVMLFNLMSVPLQSAVPATSKLQTQAQPEAETFFGTILKDNDDYVLSDSATKTRYILDNAQKASRYERIMVKVTGTLDTSRNLIHVEAIQPIF